MFDFVVALGDQNFIRDVTIFCYLAKELFPAIESAGRIGLPAFELIKRVVESVAREGRDAATPQQAFVAKIALQIKC
ncbi:phage holin family protein [Brevibacillus parabrevis]|uniref:phage holin family protein n=1 Tax=Brevibacillus parabrevis TaxID=54914 RepID=UPI002FC34121